ncbi:unnamed protein product [Phytomonas sp. EM1]|nr:unnamed protein product [Phytomonas sp. EM1]|eukprot:CCW61455.1 unnamed protein product [Phytomonas sp. isolate EM1]
MSQHDEEHEVSFLDALRSRYGTDDIETYDPSAFLVGVGGKSNKKWELLGMEKTRLKQACYDRLIHVVLRDTEMTVAVKQAEVFNKEDVGRDIGVKDAISSPKDQLQAACMVRLQELDLSRNPKFPFTELVKLVRYFPSLETLQISDSPELLVAAQGLTLTVPHTPPELALISTRITKLVLNNTGFKSVYALRALVELPVLQELHLDSNNIESYRLFETNEEETIFRSSWSSSRDDAALLSWLRFPKVTTLSLAHNKLHSWASEDLSEALISAFPALTHLYLTDNQMPDLILPQEVVQQNEEATLQTLQTNHANTFAEYTFLKPLKLLCLKDNSTLTDPRTIDAIRVLCRCLEVFRITYSTLFPHWNDTLSRMYVVASLPTINLLNRGQVRPKERLDSEIFYIQRGLAKREAEHQDKCKTEQLTPEVEADGAVAPLVAIGEPNYLLLDFLFEKHKDVVLSIYREGTTASTDGSSHIMLNVTLQCENNFKSIGGNSGNYDIFNTVQKTLPSNLTIAKLKSIIRIVFQIDPINQVLSFKSGDTGVLDTAIAMDNEQQTLAYFGVSNGSKIIVRDTSVR